MGAAWVTGAVTGGVTATTGAGCVGIFTADVAGAAGPAGATAPELPAGAFTGSTNGDDGAAAGGAAEVRCVGGAGTTCAGFSATGGWMVGAGIDGALVLFWSVGGTGETRGDGCSAALVLSWALS